MTTASAIEFGRPAVRKQSLWRYWRGGLRGSEFIWALAFLVPYIGVFFAFVVYPVFYGLRMGSEPSLYTEVFSDPIYQQTVINTLIFVTFGVNLKLFFALLLSGFFMRPGWWVKGLLMIFVLPWAVPALPSFISIHWMLNGEWGLLNKVVPGDQLVLTAQLERSLKGIWKFSTVALVGDQEVAHADMMVAPEASR